MGEFELVPHMRIDFNIIPIEGDVCYSLGLRKEIFSTVRKLVGVNLVDKCDDIYVSICQGKLLFGLMVRKFDGPNEFDNQLRDGDPGFVVIRGAALGFVEKFPGDDWDQKFDNARFYIMSNLNCKLFDRGAQMVITHLHPSEDAYFFTNLLSRLRDSNTPPTILLHHLPHYWLVRSQQPSLQNFFRTLAKIRVLDIGQTGVSIQFKNYKHCYKGLKKLCSHSLKNNRYDGKLAVYDLTLKDKSVVFDVLAYNESTVNLRVTMLEEEIKTIKAILENSKIPKGSSKAQALNHRAKMLEKRLDVVRSAMEEIGADSQCLLSLYKELSTVKMLVEDVSIDPIQALEIRVQALENELKIMKQAAAVHNESPTDQSLKRCKR